MEVIEIRYRQARQSYGLLNLQRIHLIYFYHCLYISIYDNELLTTTLNWDIFCIVAFVFYCSKEEAVLLFVDLSY